MKTKISFILIFYFAGTAIVFSQTDTVPGSTLRLETGYAFTGSGDLSGYCLYNEYSIPFGKRFAVAPGGGVLNFFGDDVDNTYNTSILLTNATCVSFDLTGYFYPLMLKFLDVETGLGLYYRRWHWIYATGPDNSFVGPQLALDPGSHGHTYIWSPGYIVSFGTVLKISRHLGLSLRGIFQNDINGDNCVTIRFGATVRL